MTNPADASPVVRFPQHFHLLRGEPIDDSSLTVEEMDAWSDRVCGLASLRTVLAYHRLQVPSQTELFRSAERADLFTSQGIIHAGLAELGKPYGLTGQAVGGVDLSELLVLADRGYPPIVSVTHQLPTDGRRGGHLMVVIGTAGVDDVHFVDPSRWGMTQTQVPRARIAASFSHRAIIYWRATDACPLPQQGEEPGMS